MDQRLIVARRALVLGGAALFGAFAARAGSVRTQPLFVIARSKNTNVVHYDARVHQGGRRDAAGPAMVYRVLRAEDGRREAPSFLERKLAYGFTTRFDAGGDALTLELQAFSRRGLRVRRDENGYFHAEATLATRRAARARLRRVRRAPPHAERPRPRPVRTPARRCTGVRADFAVGSRRGEELVAA